MNEIEIVNISKKYKIYKHPADRIKDWLTPARFKFHQEFWALKNINLNVRKGISLGIIGVNGAGKSTLLKVLSHTSQPTTGYCKIHGRVSALLELGTGFHPDFTGIQNIFMNGRLLGMTDDFLNRRLNSIVEFSELGDFINRPLRTYSTGMSVRLAFSVAASVDPDALIIDEALSVGDVHFQQKCIKRLREFKESGKTILFVSHDLGTVSNLCDEAVLLNEGQLLDWGKPDEIIDHYNALVTKRSAKNVSLSIERLEISQSQRRVQRSGNFLALISEVVLKGANGEPASTFISGTKAKLVIKVFFFDKFHNPTIGMQIKDRLGQPVFGMNTNLLNINTGEINPGDTLEVAFDFPMGIGEGEYTMTVAAHTQDTHLEECFDWADKILTFQILADHTYRFYGIARIPATANTEVKRMKPENVKELLGDIFRDAPKELTMGMNYQKYLCKGWYLPQGDFGTEERWTDKEFAGFINLDGNVIEITANSYKPDQHIKPIRADVFIEDIRVGEMKIDSTHYQTFKFDIPEKFRGTIGFFRCALDEGWSPNAYDSSNSDGRTLGVMVKKVSVYQNK